MRTLTVQASGTYDILIGASLADCGEAIRSVTGGETIAIVTDSNVAPLYLDPVQRSLQQAGFRTAAFVLPAGEASKNAQEYLRLLDFLVEHEITRKDTVVALGGGVVGDLSGFAAATYLRGVRYVQLPTTLLAMVDSSVGGKTAIDLPGGKNLCGAFHQPSLVLIDCATLSTLSAREFSSGCAEVIKYGLLQDPEILRLCAQGAVENLEELIYRSLVIKSEIVMRDERDIGERQLLNLGHTVGHAIEQEADYTLAHGECVAIGMVIVTRAAIANGDCTADVLPSLISLLERYALPTRSPFAADALSKYLRSDKKRQGASITLVVPEHEGCSRLMPMPMEQLLPYLTPGFEENAV